MLDTQDTTLSISAQCNLLTVSRSSFYYVPAGESPENLAIMRYLVEQYFSAPYYGALRLTAALTVLGYKVNIKRVRRLMKLVDWKTIYKEPRTTVSDKTHDEYPYLLRNLPIVRNNQVWAMDITYIPMKRPC
jgi:putative transposase